MRIHSDFKDYYDSAQGMGIDPAIRYLRRSQGHAVDWQEIFSHITTRTDYKSFLVGFCGTLYPGLKRFPPMRDPEIFYSPPEPVVVKQKRKRRYGYSRFTSVETFGDFWLSQGKQSDELFLKFKAPVFLVHYQYISDRELTLETNPFLKPLEFQKVKDPFTAFQDIATYISNVLVVPDKPDDIPDKFKVEQHGFDKWSFRKQSKQA